MNAFWLTIWKRRVCHMALFLCAGLWSGYSQEFQQEVNYRIHVTLNDSLHVLNGYEEIEYINRSGDPLSFIWFHLWPNAYRSSQTALGKQLLQHGRTSLYFADASMLGSIDSLDFKVDGKKAHWQPDALNHDIGRLHLTAALLPGDTVRISTPFRVKIPHAKFSRLGHNDQAYYISQWYPKPAVYDSKGWHPMPYLDQGEFFSEYGSFDVSVTLPENYMLAATGDRVDSAEEERLLSERIAATKVYLLENRADTAKKIPSSARLKTVRFRQEKVHDFAWFADKRFLVLRDQIELPGSGHQVDTWIFFTPQNAAVWKDALSYVNRATLFYSKQVGDYPYRHVTAVDGTIMAGGGMEYPNITVIGSVYNPVDLDLVITHEIGHNWFYGILGSNERDYPFLDEGVNSLYEMRYVKAFYPELKLTKYLGKDSSFTLFRLNRFPYWRNNELMYYTALRGGFDQPLDLGSEAYPEFAYGALIYSKTPLILDYFRDLMGDTVFDRAMQAYYRKYKFRHPAPGDLLAVLSEAAGRDLSGIWQQLVSGTATTDYKISRAKRNQDGSFRVKVKNRGSTVLPFNLYAMKNGTVSHIAWSEGFEGSRVINMPAPGAEVLRLDGGERMPDFNRRNNSIRTSGMFRKAGRPQLNLISALEDPERTQVNYLPLAGANYYNGLMAGIAVHNYGIYPKKFQFILSPFYGFRNQRICGSGRMLYTAHPKGIFRELSIGLKAKTFAYDEWKPVDDVGGPESGTLLLNYYKLAPFLSLEIRNRHAVSGIRQTITLRSNQLFTDSLALSTAGSGAIAATKRIHTVVNEWAYQLKDRRALDPYELNVGMQQSGSMLKAFANCNYEITLSPRLAFDIRIFAGSFLSGTEAERSYFAFRASGYNGYHDYLFEHNFLARNLHSGPGFSQFAEEDGAMKVWSALGQSPEWLASANLKSPKLMKLPLRLFADVVICDARYLSTDLFLWDAGVNISLWKNVFDIYIPLVYSPSVADNLALQNVGFLNRIRFTFNIHKFDPGNFLKNNLF